MKHIEEIGIMRIILILCIVIGHTFAVYSLKSAPWPLPEGISAVPEYRWFNEVFISFALQTFVFVSGYLMALSENTREISRIRFIKKKAIRLLIPTLIFGLAYLYLIDTNVHIKSIRYFIYYLTNGAGHLWFLPMLFLCFAGAIFFTPRKKMTLLAWITLLAISFLSMVLPNIIRISQACFYFIFFIEGYYFCSLLPNTYYIDNKRIIVGGGNSSVINCIQSVDFRRRTCPFKTSIHRMPTIVRPLWSTIFIIFMQSIKVLQYTLLDRCLGWLYGRLHFSSIYFKVSAISDSNTQSDQSLSLSDCNFHNNNVSVYCSYLYISETSHIKKTNLRESNIGF